MACEVWRTQASPVKLKKKKDRRKKKKNSHNLQYLPTNAFITKLLFVYYAHTTVISSCFPSKFCISRRQALKELFVVSSTQMRAASYSLPSLRCSEVKRITGASENLSCNIRNREMFREINEIQKDFYWLPVCSCWLSVEFLHWNFLTIVSRRMFLIVWHIFWDSRRRSVRVNFRFRPLTKHSYH